ncbi:mitochondrial basic amino acids transporter-like [Euwallacea fornicatus]|uniref:mitochondrial basic amino acids transporter-like n=1 Tax=Euwallacea fornicatus TaxID=995702 RepID=UPI00338E87CB
MALDFIAGCLGGCAGVIVGHPLDTVKVCLQTQDAKNPRYKGTLHCLKSIVGTQGFRGIYRGVSSPLAGVAGINAVVFGVYRNTQKIMPNPDCLLAHAYAGAASGFIQSFICSPMELAKSVMQVGKTSSKDPLDCLKSIYRKKGLRGIYKGLSLTILRDVPAFSSYFITFELITRRNDDLPISTFNMLLGGGLAGVTSWVIPYPVDVIKTRLQTDGISVTKYANVYDCLTKSVKGDGVSCLFKGIWPTVIRAFPVNAVTFTVVTWSMNFFNNFTISPETILNHSELLLTAYIDVVVLNSVEQALIAIL